MRLISVVFILSLMVVSTHAYARKTKSNVYCTGQVARVLDGDTVIVKCHSSAGEKRIRIAEIDTPETSKRNKACFGMPYGDVATNAAKEVLLGRTVDVVGHNKDRYGRLVAKLFVNVMDYARYMVKHGYAHVYSHYARDKQLKQLGRLAKQEKVGIWSLPRQCQMYPPKWRRIHNTSERCSIQKKWRLLGCPW